MEAKEMETLLTGKFGSETESMITATLKRFNHLITRDVAVELLAKEHGLLSQSRICTVKEVSELIQKGEKLSNVTVCGTLRYFLPTKIIMKKGSVLRLREITLEQDGARTKITFWNESINVLSNFSLGDSVEFKNLYSYSRSLTYGKSSGFRITNKCEILNPDQETLVEKKPYVLQGTVIEIEPDYFYVKENREDRMKSFRMTVGNGIMRILVWESVSRVDKLQPGDIVRVEGALFRNNEFHLNQMARIIKLKVLGDDVVVGRIESVSVTEPELLTIRVAERDFPVSREVIAKFIGSEKMSDDIDTSTLVELCKGSLEGKKVALKQDTGGSSAVKDIYFLG